MTPFSNTRMVLRTPAIPLAPSKCPMFDLTAPMNSGSSEDLSGPNIVPMAPASIGSPFAISVMTYSKLLGVFCTYDCRSGPMGFEISRCVKVKTPGLIGGSN